MDKQQRIALVNLHHGLGQCRQDSWERVGPYFEKIGIDLTFREVSTIQSVYRYELSNDTQLNLADLAKRIHLKNAVTSQIVSNLVDKGLMLRTDDKENRRKVIISLTEMGQKIAEDIALIADDYLDKYLSVLTDDERSELFRIAAKLNPQLPY